MANSGDGALTSRGVISYTQITNIQAAPADGIFHKQDQWRPYTRADAFRIGDISGDYSVNVNTQRGPTVIGGGNEVGGGITITATNVKRSTR